MVEGHSCHRIARLTVGRRMLGKKYHAISPNGRFAAGAASIDGRVFRKIECIGKNLFAFFSRPTHKSNSTKWKSTWGPQTTFVDDVVVHVHFGMSGRWGIFSSSTEPETTPTTRLRLEEITSSGEKIVSHLSAMTVQEGGPELFDLKASQLGQDPLREDANPEVLYEKIAKSKKTIGQLLMDQGFFAGVGNIYRCEILLTSGIHPNTPARVLTEDQLALVWTESVRLMKIGFETGRIITIDSKKEMSPHAHGKRRYVYNSSSCAKCGGNVTSWDIDNRTVYCCSSCQPRQAGFKGQESDRAVKNERSPILFNSKCAGEPLVHRAQTPEKLSVSELRNELDKYGVTMPKQTRKPALVARLQSIQQDKMEHTADLVVMNDSDLVESMLHGYHVTKKGKVIKAANVTDIKAEDGDVTIKIEDGEGIRTEPRGRRRKRAAESTQETPPITRVLRARKSRSFSVGK